jgi:hypothetical protein
MNDVATRTPVHLWIVAVLATLWNAFGGYDYVMTQSGNEAYMAMFTAEQRVYLESFPTWVDAAWAFGVWGGVLGSLLLLARSRHAELAFAASLLGLLVSSVYQYALTDMPAGMMTPGMIALTVAIWAVAIFLFLYARNLRAKGVLR